jgi:serine/threonine protein kinase
MKITDFELYECVGIGNFGKVHKALNKVHNRIVAIKILKKESVAAMKHVDHIINEREVLQYLSDRNREYALENPVTEDDDGYGVPECPFLMDIFSSFSDKEFLYFELEYIQGCTLLSQIR